MSDVKPRTRISRWELFKLAEDEGQIVICDKCEGALTRDGHCPRCEKELSNAVTQLEIASAEHTLEPLGWQELLVNGVPDIDYLDPPYFVRLARHWIWGATGTAKSIYVMWKTAAWSRDGVNVCYFSEENPLSEELRRLSLVAPDPEFFRIFYRTGMDLTDSHWVRAFLETTKDADVVVLDS